VVTALAATTMACASHGALDGESSRSPGPTFAPVTAPGPTFADLTSTTQPAASIVDALVVAPERPRTDYDRERFGDWVDADADGCDTACEAYVVQRRDDLPGLPAGGWVSAYDAYSSDDPVEFQVDHVVALAEAWDSGAATWDDSRLNAFYNDLDSELLVVTAASNQSKSDRDPAEWQPPNQDAWCDFAIRWVTVKARYGLTVDEAEVRALRQMLGHCP
jgi:hypothetical protein